MGWPISRMVSGDPESRSWLVSILTASSCSLVKVRFVDGQDARGGSAATSAAGVGVQAHVQSQVRANVQRFWRVGW